jgi:hypothetical protein
MAKSIISDSAGGNSGAAGSLSFSHEFRKIADNIRPAKR